VVVYEAGPCSITSMGTKKRLQLARVPTEAQEQLRLASRQHDQLVEERKRLGAKGNAMLLSQGFGSWSNWWRPKSLDPIKCAGAGLVTGAAQDLGRCAQDVG
jgi:hypothetical protein